MKGEKGVGFFFRQRREAKEEKKEFGLFGFALSVGTQKEKQGIRGSKLVFTYFKGDVGRLPFCLGGTRWFLSYVSFFFRSDLLP